LLATLGCASDAPEIVVEAPPEMNDGFLVGEGDLPGESSDPGLQDPGSQCLGETHQAERIGLDMFVMLDISGSMLETLPLVSLLAPPLTKWDAVRESLETFVQDGETADIGVGLQYFPQVNEDVPLSCATNDECGAFGPCSNSICVVEDELDIGGGDPPVTFFRAGETQDACSADSDCAGDDEGCRTMIGACVFPVGAIGNADGAFVNVGETEDQPVLALCNEPADCEGLPLTECEELGVCTLELVGCTFSVGCPLGAGDCVPFPYGCADQTSCDETRYSAPAVPISSGPTRSGDVIASLRAQVPQGQTPTGPALGGALEQARLWAEQHPDRQVVTVLATDGFPTTCDPLEIPDIAELATAAAASARPVRTFVIGVFSTADLGDDGQERLDEIARAGGSDSAFVINTAGNVSDEFLEALNLIRKTAASCDFQLDSAASLNFDRVNLQVTDAAGASTGLLNVGDASACGSDDGWYYVRDAAGTPTQISVCPNTCTTFTEEGVRADLQVGCATRIR
jgi:hypothetical protein